MPKSISHGNENIVVKWFMQFLKEEVVVASQLTRSRNSYQDLKRLHWLQSGIMARRGRPRSCKGRQSMADFEEDGLGGLSIIVIEWTDALRQHPHPLDAPRDTFLVLDHFACIHLAASVCRDFFHRSLRSLLFLLLGDLWRHVIASNSSISSWPKTPSITWMGEDSSKLSGSSIVVKATASSSGSGGGGMY